MAIAMLLDVVMAYVDQTLLEAAAFATGVESGETPLPMEPFTFCRSSLWHLFMTSREGLVVVVQQRRGLLDCLLAVVSGQTPKTSKQKPVQNSCRSMPEMCRNLFG